MPVAADNGVPWSVSGDEMIDETYVRAAARALGLDLPENRVAEVLIQMKRIEAVASPVLEAKLETDQEPANVWRP